MLFAGEPLAGDPNLFQIEIAPAEGAATLLRSGDLPRVAQVVTIGDLPAADSAIVTGGLYKSRIDITARTHTCAADAPVHLVAGETATASLVCTEVAGGPSVKSLLN
jgi:hypothetical protein